MPSRRARRQAPIVKDNRQAQDDEEHHHPQTQQEEEEEEEEEKKKKKKKKKKKHQVQRKLKSLQTPEKYPNLQEIRKGVQCPICLGIIRKTRTVMECLHRFCKGCIDKSIRLGNNECPACRKHIASRRSLRDDPNHDALILALFEDIDKYEEEELTFHEEERTRNKEIQASISETFKRQSEAQALDTKGKDEQPTSPSTERTPRPTSPFTRTTPRSTSPFTGTTPRRARNSGSRRGRDGRERKNQRSCGNEDDNNGTGDRGSHSNDENTEEPEPRRPKKRLGTRPSCPSTVNSNGIRSENEVEARQEGQGISTSHVEVLPSAVSDSQGGIEFGDDGDFNTRRAQRVERLTEHFRNLHETADLEIHLLLVPEDKETTANLKYPFLSVPAKLTIHDLRVYVSRHSPLAAEEVEILVVKAEINLGEGVNPSFSKDDLKLLEGGRRTLGEVLEGHPLLRKEYTLAFRRKETAN